MKTKLIWFTAIGLVLWMVWSVYAATFDATKSYRQLMDWTLLNQRDDTHTEMVDSAVLDSGEAADSGIQIVLHITMAHADANAAGDPAYADELKHMRRRTDELRDGYAAV